VFNFYTYCITLLGGSQGKKGVFGHFLEKTFKNYGKIVDVTFPRFVTFGHDSCGAPRAPGLPRRALPRPPPRGDLPGFAAACACVLAQGARRGGSPVAQDGQAWRQQSKGGAKAVPRSFE